MDEIIANELHKTYICTKCHNKLLVSELNREFPIVDLYKHTGRTLCTSCRSVGTMDLTYIKCRIRGTNTENLILFKYTLRCNLCNAMWEERAKFANRAHIVRSRRHIEASANCINSSCASHSFTMVGCSVAY